MTYNEAPAWLREQPLSPAHGKLLRKMDWLHAGSRSLQKPASPRRAAEKRNSSSLIGGRGFEFVLPPRSGTFTSARSSTLPQARCRQGPF